MGILRGASGMCLLLLCLLLRPLPPGRAQVLGDEFMSDEWVYCSQLQGVMGGALPNCFCAPTLKDTLKVNCNGVAFQQDFPALPPKQPITEFSWKGVKAQNIPPQAFASTGTPLEHLDLSENNLRRLSDKALQGLGETLETLDLSHNLLGDQLNPIFSSQELNRLPRLRTLRLSHNGIRKIDNGLLEGTLSLQEVHLDGNELSVVPSEALNGPKALRTLNLGNNLIQEVGSGDFSRQRRLLHINLTSNRISGIASGGFVELENLKVLLLAWNHFQRINSDAFNGLETLEELSLANNFLREVPKAALTHLVRLRRLDLSANLIYNLTAEDFASLRVLTTLNLSRNRLTTIPDNSFKHLQHLETLDLSVNQLRTIHKKLFQGLTHLRSLDLSDNNLLLFPMDALQPITGLRQLFLDFNRISAIQSIPTPNLTTLSIAHNLIRHIPPDGLSHLLQLHNLNLQGNQLESLEELQFPLSLLQLNTSRNNLTVVPRLHLPLLHTFDASHNHIQHILPHNFLLLPQLHRLHLGSNEIRNLSVNAFKELRNLGTLDLSQNQVQNLLNIQELPSLRLLNLSSNEIASVQTLVGLPSLQVLDLSKNHLTQLQEPLMENGETLTHLRLDGNGLNSFRGLQGTFSSLKTLSLSRNLITYVFPHAFDNITSIAQLDFSHNQLTFFPTESVPTEALTALSLAHNSLRHIHEVSFSNFPRLRTLELNSNSIETLPQEPFTNSSQVQFINLSENKIEELGNHLFRGLYRLELNLASNYLSLLSSTVFSRNNVQRLHSIDLRNNALSEVPTNALQPQIFYLEKLVLANNSIRTIPPNSNVLVNVKHLDVSSNPLSAQASSTLLNEPKTTRVLNMANTETGTIPVIEIPFLRSLDLSGNQIMTIPPEVFKRTTLLDTLVLSQNPISEPPTGLPLTLRHLDLSGTWMETLRGTPFPTSLRRLLLNNLHRITRLEKGALNLPLLTDIEIRDSPKLGYIDIKGILNNLHFLERIDFEVKDAQILDQIHPALSPRLNFIALRGKTIRSVSTGALAGLSAPSVQILMTNTSLSTLPPILVPVPASAEVTIDISDSNILTISPPILSSQNIRILGINPHCDCNAIHLINYLKSIQSAATCSSPPSLLHTPISQIQPNQLLCSTKSKLGGITKPPQRPTTHPTYPTEGRRTTTDDIIWSLPQTTPTLPSTTNHKAVQATTPKQTTSTMMDTNAMDTLIYSILAGVTGLLILFLVTICCCYRRKRGSGSRREGGGHPQFIPPPGGHHHHHLHQQGKCTCKGTPMPFQHGATVRSHHSLYHQPQGNLSASVQQMNLSQHHQHAAAAFHHQQQQQQQQIYASLPYFLQYEENMRR